MNVYYNTLRVYGLCLFTDLELNSANMLDVYRSDSQKSDSSTTRPRVSFNRDVRIKKIGRYFYTQRRYTNPYENI